VDFFRNEVDQRIYLAMLTPVFDGQDGKQSIGILALLIDPHSILSLCQSLASTDKTAETLLFAGTAMTSFF